MPTQTDKKVTELLKPMLKKKLFVALSKALVAPEDMLAYLPEHLAYMNRMESEGNIFASGPFLQEGALVGDGLTCGPSRSCLDSPLNLQPYRAVYAEATGRCIEDDRHTRVIMQAEPLIKRSLREFDLRPWELREGR